MLTRFILVLSCPFSTKSLLRLHSFLLTRLFFQSLKKQLKQRTPCDLWSIAFLISPWQCLSTRDHPFKGSAIFHNFFPYPPTISIPAKCLLRHADILNGWSLSFWGSELLSNPFSFILVWCTFFLIQSSILVGWLVSIPHNRSYCFSSRQKYESAR